MTPRNNPVRLATRCGLCLATLLMVAMTACGTSIPTQDPPASAGLPTPVPTSSPVQPPEVDFAPEGAPPTTTPGPITVEGDVPLATESVPPTATAEPTVTPPSAAITPGPVQAEQEAPEPEGETAADQTEAETPSATGTPVPTPTAAPEPENTPGATPAGESGEENVTTTGEGPENQTSPAEPEPITPAPAPEPEPQPQPTVTPAPTQPPTATPRPEPTPAPRLGSRVNPIPLGQYGEVRDYRTTWQLSVGDIDPDAWDIIQKENQFNKPPDENKQYYMLTLKVRNIGEQRAFFVDYVKTTGEAVNWGYTTSQDSCGVFPGSNSRELFPGGEFELNVCWHVAKADLPTLMMYWDEAPTDRTVWFALK